MPVPFGGLPHASWITMLPLILFSSLLLCNPVRGAPNAEPTQVPPPEITPAPTTPPVELLRRGPIVAIVPRDGSEFMKRQACGAYYVTCDNGSCCFMGQECFKNAAGVNSCRYPVALDYESLLSSLSFGGGDYLSLLSSVRDDLTKYLTKSRGAVAPTTSRHSGGAPASAAIPTSSPGSSYSSNGDTNGNTTSRRGKKSNTGMIVGIVVGSVIGLAVLVAVIWYCCHKKHKPTFYPQPVTQPVTQLQEPYVAQAAAMDAKPPQTYAVPQPPLPAEIGGTGIAPPQGNAFYTQQSAGYTGPTSPPPPQPLAQEMSGDAQFPPQQHDPPRIGTPGQLAEMDSGHRK